MGALAAVHPSSYNPLGVLDRQPPLTGLKKDDHCHHKYHKDNQKEDSDDTHLPQSEVFIRAGHGTGHSGNDSCKDDQGDAVPDSSFRDLFAQPHDEGCPRG